MSTKHGPKGKGKTIQGKAATKSKRVAKSATLPEAVADDAASTEADAPASDDTPAGADVPFEDAAPIEETPEAAPAPKRTRDMSIEDLRAEYLRVIGRETGSTDRRYLMWKLSEAAKGKITVGAIEKRAPRDKSHVQVLPLGMERTVVAKLDAAWKALGFKSRMAFLRDAMVAYLREQEGAEANAAADAIEAEGF